MKFSNTTGPVKPDIHYCLPLSSRLDEQELRLLIDQEKYFVLHAPRQTGKTSIMLNFANQLNNEGKYSVLYVNVKWLSCLFANTPKKLFGYSFK